MKNTILTIILALFSVICSGQNNGDLKFLGIPINGTESQFSTQLKGKGFTYNAARESYQGQFNGKPVDVYIHTNHNLVDRVYVAFPHTSEEDIKSNGFSILCFSDKYLVDLSMRVTKKSKD